MRNHKGTLLFDIGLFGLNLALGFIAGFTFWTGLALGVLGMAILYFVIEG